MIETISNNYKTNKKITDIQTEEKNRISDILNINIFDKQFDIIKKSDSKIEWQKFWLNISNPIPIYFLKWGSPIKGWYHHELNLILIFENWLDYTIHHEILHSIEHAQEKTIELINLYNKAKEIITEDSFKDWFYAWNFKKNIWEFIADWYSKPAFINVLKKEKLHDKFLNETKYLFKQK